ncbi:unnamed protein product [Larinioides sclopetarius]|uniref:Uncharacterized protein n=1 Tax=Larinioides sclopetarius TaxID=280406 RepID=A0AAV1Z2H5_9ARAC
MENNNHYLARICERCIIQSCSENNPLCFKS